MSAHRGNRTCSSAALPCGLLLAAGCLAGAPGVVRAAAPEPASAAAETPPTPIERLRPLVHRGDFDAARTLTREMLAQAIATHGRESIPAADALDAVVSLAFFRGRCEDRETLSLAREVIALKERLAPADRAGLAVSVNNEANIHWCAADYGLAGPLYRRALALREQALGPDHPMVGQSVSNLATYLQFMGDYGEARPLFDRAIAILEKNRGPEHRDVAQVLNNASNNLAELGDLEGARTALLRAVAIQEKVIGPTSGDVGGTLDGLANLLGRMGDLAGARATYERAFAIFRKNGDGRFQIALGSRELADRLVEAGENEEARRLYRQALAISETDPGRYPHEIASNLHGLGALDLRSGALEAARRELGRALKMREKTLGRTHPAVAATWSEIARLEVYSSRPERAFEVALTTEATSRRQFMDVASSLSEREVMRYERLRVDTLDIATSALSAAGRPVAPSEAARAWDAVIRSRALVLDELAARHHVSLPAATPEVQSLVDRFESARSRLARLAIRGPEDDGVDRYAEDLKQAQRDRDAAERAVLEQSAALRMERTRRMAGLPEVAAALPKDSALLAYVGYRQLGSRPGSPDTPSYLAFVLRQGQGHPSMVSLGAAQRIDTAIDRWKALVQSDPRRTPGRNLDADYRAASSELRAAIWDPVARSLGGVRLVLVVPDGAIHQVSLATLVDQDGRFLIESGPRLHYLSAERDLAGDSGARPSGRGLLVLGGPDFDTRPAAADAVASARESSPPAVYRGPAALCAARGALRFDPLDAAGQEAIEIGALWEEASASGVADARDALVLTGRSAGEAAFKALAPGRRVMHVATHGFELDTLCPSVLRTTNGASDGADPDGRPSPVTTLDNPLLLSGLALAGANVRNGAGGDGADEDGMLTAEEIAALDLSGVEWVVLAACRSGSGAIVPGEGVLGLRRAFEVAGARTLITSLWPVEDDSTRLWMRRLYGSRLAGRSTAESVRTAGLALLQEQRRAGWSAHPFYWGAFVAAGDWR